jgi:protoporphyrinogen oxidase
VRRVVILGAGAAGLGASLALRRLRIAFELLEGESGPGGLARTDIVDGFSFDRTGHVLHFAQPEVERRFRAAGARLERSERRAGVLLGEREIPYPFQYNLWALGSPELARVVVADMRRAQRNGDGNGSFDDLLLSTWGETGVSLFFRPYNEKLWGRPLKELPTDCAGRFLPAADLALAERGARSRVQMNGYNGTFLYPASGRLGDVMAALACPIAGSIRYGDPVAALDLGRRRLETAAGATVGYDALISTIPLDRLIAMAGIPAPGMDLFAATKILNVRVGLRGSLRTRLHWVYVADRELPFHRIGFPQNVNRRTCPDGCTSLSIEYTIPEGGPELPAAKIARSALAHLARLGLVAVEEELFHDAVLISPAYVVQRAPGREAFARLETTLSEHGVWTAGRFGTWDYLSVEESFASGTRAARSCAAVAP